jgi:hypothetical protein
MSSVFKSFCLTAFLIVSAAGAATAQNAAVQVPLETTTGWGPIDAPDGYKALRIQGRTSTDFLALAKLFGDFAAHPAMFPRVVAGVDILTCDAGTLKARYRTSFDPKPGGKTTVESLSTIKMSRAEDRIEFVWSSSDVKSSYVNAAWGRALFVKQRGPNGPETLIDYISAVRPKNSAKGVLVESQKGVLAGDARYVIDRLIALGRESRSVRSPDVLSCP